MPGVITIQRRKDQIHPEPSKISNPVLVSGNPKINPLFSRQPKGFIPRYSVSASTAAGLGITGKSSLNFVKPAFQRFSYFVRKPSGAGQKEYFLSHDRYFLFQQSNPLGNIYDFLSQRLAGRGGKEYFLSHDRYFLFQQSNPLGNIYDFLSHNLSGRGGRASFHCRNIHFDGQEVYFEVKMNGNHRAAICDLAEIENPPRDKKRIFQ